jgi:hypothetical protein
MESHAASLVRGSGHRHQPPSQAQAGPNFGAHMTEDDSAPICQWGVPECTLPLWAPKFGEARTSSSSSMTRHARSGSLPLRPATAALAVLAL